MRIVRIDLISQKIGLSEIPKEWEKTYIGGKGIATKLLFELPQKIDPLSPQNILIFGIGPVNGVNLSGASRMTCVFKSPMTNGYGESQCGGFLAPEFKKAGVDFLYITGRAEKPVYLLIEDDNIEVRDASHLWGKDTFETEEILKKDHKGEVLCIGQAGENLVRFACISHRKGRQFGRAGVGAVMGSKNLKAVVVKGSSRVEVANPEELREFRKWLIKTARERLQSLTKYGTPGIMSLTNEAGVLPTRYWTKGSFDGFEDINAEALSRYVKKHTACYGCAVVCGIISKTEDAEVEGPEYETLFALGSLCENNDLKAIIKAAELCDRYGMDTITTGNVIAFLMACSEIGEVEEDIKFGDSEKIIELIKKIAFRERIGNILAEGVSRAAEILKVSVEPIHCKGLEPPGYDPRGLFGMALGYAVSPRGACHMRSCAYRPNLMGAVDRTSPKGQAALVKELEDMYCVVDSFILCRFVCLPVIGPILWEELAKLYWITTNEPITVEDLKKAGERICDLVREFNIREGVKEDKLPSKFLKVTLEKGMSERTLVSEEDFKEMLEEYYILRGWKRGGRIE
ncbi:MAG: aldehyde ferredoxin oxidoreductase family protein [Archaeoglobaceae archaeon]|nr:aldehyde ferredoxin oxidoreductase family protein [Archaeoglobaceae archaeon]